MAAKMFEAEELEGMDEQEAEFEVGQRFVRLATHGRPPGGPRARVRRPRVRSPQAALVTAARRHAPGCCVRGAPRPVAGAGPAQRRRPGQRRRPAPAPAA